MGGTKGSSLGFAKKGGRGGGRRGKKRVLIGVSVFFCSSVSRHEVESEHGSYKTHRTYIRFLVFRGIQRHAHDLCPLHLETDAQAIKTKDVDLAAGACLAGADAYLHDIDLMCLGIKP